MEKDFRPASNPEWGPSRLFLTRLDWKVERPVPAQPVEPSSERTRQQIDAVKERIQSYKEQRISKEPHEDIGHQTTG